MSSIDDRLAYYGFDRKAVNHLSAYEGRRKTGWGVIDRRTGQVVVSYTSRIQIER